MSRRVALMVGPSAGRAGAAAAAAELRHRLEAEGDAVHLVGGATREEAVRLARAAVAQGVDALVVVGGDGTVHLALQAVAGTSTPLAILPTGTGNDLATCLGVPADPGETVRDIHDLAVRPAVPVDAVRVGDRWFACVLGLASTRRSTSGPTGCVGPAAGAGTTWQPSSRCAPTSPRTWS